MISHASQGSIYTRPSFWRGTAERAIKTCAQALLAVLPGLGPGVPDSCRDRARPGWGERTHHHNHHSTSSSSS